MTPTQARPDGCSSPRRARRSPRLPRRAPRLSGQGWIPPGSVWLPRRAFDEAGKNRHAVDLTAKQHFLAQLAERSEHGAERQLRAAESIYQARADHGRLWMPIELGDKPVDCTGGYDGVA